jgi:hypothetical protein
MQQPAVEEICYVVCSQRPRFPVLLPSGLLAPILGCSLEVLRIRQRPGLNDGRSHFRRSGESLQTLATGLRPWRGNPAPAAGGYAVCVLELAGRLGS